MSTVTVTAVFTPSPGHKEALVDALSRTIPAVHDERGCVLYAIHDAQDGTITMIEKWESAELLATHAAGPAVVALNAAIAAHIDGPAVVTTMTPIPVGGDQGVL
jgi:quinol monooxygenase YgiN